jgi:uncharacterized protein (DUF1778 family)
METFTEAMPTKKPRLTIYLTERQRDLLDTWAKDEHRTLTNLVAMMLDKALEEREKKSQQFQPTTLANE